MKTIKIVAFFLTSITIVNAQNIKIDSTNYCKFYSMEAHYQNSNVETTYLDETTIANIVYDEMEKLGFKWLRKFAIVKIDSNTYVSSICYSEKSKFGFLFEGSHGMVPSQENRHVISLYKEITGNDYSQKISSIYGESEFIKIKEIPKNFYILKMENYWYQESPDPIKNMNLVSKEFIYELLRQDIRKICKNRL